MSGTSLIPINHAYIEERNVAERFVNGDLRQSEREAFERHYVDCQECMDRVALAQLFRSEAKRKKSTVAIFSILATFSPHHQALIFVAATLALLLMPVSAMNWLESRASLAVPESEPVIWLPPSGSVDVRIPLSAKWISIAAPVPGEGTYRLSVVDTAGRPVVSGPDQSPSSGTAIGLRLASLPSGVMFAIIEKKAENGAYALVSRHPLILQWR